MKTKNAAEVMHQLKDRYLVEMDRYVKREGKYGKHMSEEVRWLHGTLCWSTFPRDSHLISSHLISSYLILSFLILCRPL